MKSLGDQFKEFGLIPSQGREKSNALKSAKRRPSRDKDRTSKLILELPVLGRVGPITEARGFGFITPDGGGEDLFFHLTGYAGGRAGAELLPPPGTKVIFITGSDWRRPSKRQVVRWYPVTEVATLSDDLTADQQMYDDFRRDHLKSLSWDGLWRLLRADWYCKQWKNDAPADLIDPTLEEVWKARLRQINVSDLADGAFWDRLDHCQYAFAARLHPSHPRRDFELDLFEPSPDYSRAMA